MRLGFLVLLSALISAFVGAPPARADVSPGSPVEPLERLHTLVDQVKKTFRETLQSAVARRGPDKAIESCRTEMPKPLADEEIEVGRTSHKLRNAKSAPRDWVKPLLHRWSKLSPSDMPQHELVELGPSHWGYVEPIIMEPVCLNCHGSSLSSGVQAALKREYPDDKGTGFRVGDFRGLFWAELKRKAPPTPLPVTR